MKKSFSLLLLLLLCDICLAEIRHLDASGLVAGRFKTISPEVLEAGYLNGQGDAVRGATLEETLVDGWRSLSSSIDIRAFNVPVNDDEILFTILNRHPEIFYVDPYLINYRVSSGKITSLITTYTITDKAKIELMSAEIEAATEAALAFIPAEAGDLEKALALHDYIATHCDYVLDESREHIRDIYGSLVERKAVCAGYALAYLYLLSKVNVEVDYVSADVMGHAWNLVTIDGKKYHVDVTFDDPSFAYGVVHKNFVSHANFLLNDAGIKAEDHPAWDDEVNYSASDNRFNSYFWRGTTARAIQCHKGFAYAFDNTGVLRKYNLATGEFVSNILTVSEKWPVWNKTGYYYPDKYSDVILMKGHLFYNGPTKLYSYDLSNGENSEIAITYPSSQGYLYGLHRETKGKTQACVATVSTENGTFVDFDIDIISVEDVTLDKSNAILPIDGTLSLNATILPNDATDHLFYWSSSAPEVASVDVDGVVTAKSTGTALITVTTDDGNFVASCEITAVIPVTGVALDCENAVLPLGETLSLNAVIAPEDATIQGLSWSSSEPDIASVDENGVVTANAAGETIITVTTEDGEFTDTCVITVVIPVTGVAFLNDSALVPLNDTLALNAVVSPEDATNQVLHWSSSEPEIASVDDDGVVTANALGTSIITVTTDDGGLTDTCAITVVIPVSGISLDREIAVLPIGETLALNAILAPEDATNQGVSWSSSDDKVASVDCEGIVTANATGTAVITVTTNDGGFTDTCEVTVVRLVEGVSMDHESAVMPMGGTFSLKATISPEDATNQGVAWNSSDSEIASVDANGVVTANAAGEAIVTVTTNDGGFTDTCEITVVLPVTGVSLDRSEATLPIGETLSLNAEIAPEDAANKGLSWSSSNIEVASVDANGVVTGNSVGTAVITVTTDDGGFTDTCEVTVVLPVTGVTIEQDSAMLFIGETLSLNACIAPEDATNQGIAWTSSDAEIASVDAMGVVTANASGVAIITVTTDDGGFTDTCEIKVIASVTGVTLDLDSATLSIGETLALNAEIEPEDAANKGLSWSSSAPEIASVDDDGVVTANASGDAVITVTTDDGGFTDTCEITVTAAVSGVSLDCASAIIPVEDGTIALKATIVPAKATNPGVSWSSSAPEIASVDENGVVTANALGKAIITVTTDDGGFTDSCEVTVVIPVTDISLDSEIVTLLKGGLLWLEATIYPEEASIKDVTWSSSAPEIASVDEDGAVTANAVGEAIITATTVDGGLQASCSITVISAVTGISLDLESATMTLGGDALALTATIEPEDATNKEVTWISTDPEIASVDDEGVVTANATGDAVIIATTLDGGFSAECEITVVIPVSGVTLDCESALMSLVDNELWLAATVAPEDATNQDIHWSSSNPEVASVDEYGCVTALTLGETIITVTTDDGNFTASCEIAVVIPVNGVTIDLIETTLPLGGDPIKLTASVTPEDATNQVVIWSSANPEIASVDENGVVTAIAAGETEISVTTVENGFVATCDVTVVIPVTGVALSQESATLALGGDALELIAVITPEDATDQEVLWSSSNPEVATVDDGIVTANASGNAIITVTTNDGGFTATCEITVVIPVTGVSLDNDSAVVTIGETLSLNASIAPEDATNQGLSWSSSDSEIASVDANGVVTANAIGETVITVTTEDGGFSASCEIEVIPLSKEIWLSQGWNMIAFQAQPFDLAELEDEVIMECNADAFTYAKAFSLGKAYWVFSDSERALTYSALPSTTPEMELDDKWNFIGVSGEVPEWNLEEMLVFTWDGKQFAPITSQSQILQGKGYLVKKK